jgi:hypothetical protein
MFMKMDHCGEIVVVSRYQARIFKLAQEFVYGVIRFELEAIS